MALRNVVRSLPNCRSAVSGLNLTRSFASGVSEEGLQLAEISGLPDSLIGRQCEIYSPCRTAGQQGKSNTGSWKLRFSTTPKWENPLMGWTSTGDELATMAEFSNGIKNFRTAEDAAEFCNKHAISYTIRYPKKMVNDHPATIKGKAKGVPKAYADNFSFKRKGVPQYE